MDTRRQVVRVFGPHGGLPGCGAHGVPVLPGDVRDGPLLPVARPAWLGDVSRSSGKQDYFLLDYFPPPAPGLGPLRSFTSCHGTMCSTFGKRLHEGSCRGPGKGERGGASQWCAQPLAPSAAV